MKIVVIRKKLGLNSIKYAPRLLENCVELQILLVGVRARVHDFLGMEEMPCSLIESHVHFVYVVFHYNEEEDYKKITHCGVISPKEHRALRLIVFLSLISFPKPPLSTVTSPKEHRAPLRRELSEIAIAA
ncbi:hypothetical protein L484_018975 [Morus notabilis]|uniref:Uncharacterized protein n=1 Tax=Morus notabilis TaxID=981085 RepID=W9RJH2_9ROSA|nr:hypothetical protein L484_018975 [Morus notabilis]